jgi:ribosomal protein S18 acetylase RimI-like enzyme
MHDSGIIEKKFLQEANMSIVIRPASEADIEDISRLFEQGDAWHRQYLPQLFRQPDLPGRDREHLQGMLLCEEAVLFLAEQDGERVGMVNVLINQSRDIPILVPRRYAVIDHVIVDERCRRQGIGQALVEAAEAWARQQGIQDVELNVFEFNQGAIALYEKMGYATRSRRMHKSLD